LQDWADGYNVFGGWAAGNVFGMRYFVSWLTGEGMHDFIMKRES